MKRKEHIFKRDKEKKVKVEKKFIKTPLSDQKQKPTHIVIHEVSLGTGKSSKDYNMERYYEKMKADAARGATIGYHYLVGDNNVWQFIPDDEVIEHTGTEFGNHNSIGIERLICEGVNYEYAIHNQAKLITTLMLKHDIPIENVLTHKEIQKRYGSEKAKAKPKQCPARLLAGFRGTLKDFQHEIERCFLYGWFFEELLDEKQKEKISGLMIVAKQKEKNERTRKKEERRKKC